MSVDPFQGGRSMLPHTNRLFTSPFTQTSTEAEPDGVQTARIYGFSLRSHLSFSTRDGRPKALC